MRLTPPAVLLIQRPDTHFYPYQFYAAVYTAWQICFPAGNGMTFLFLLFVCHFTTNQADVHYYFLFLHESGMFMKFF